MTSRAVATTGTPDPVPLGTVVAGTYKTDRILGRGASGVVYAAKRLTDGERVALKIIFPEHCHTRQIFKRYEREAAILRRIGGEHIVRFLDFVEHDGLLAIALEHVDGSPLEELVERPMELGRAVTLAVQISRGLTAAHEAGVIHRDLKPANVVVQRGAAGERARILDFGLAKVVHGDKLVTGLTERDMIFGTPEYMAPEQARGDDLDARCDVYALGVMLYEMMTGSVPIRGKTPLATMTAQLTEAIEAPRARAPDRAIPSALEAIVLRALEKDPGRRFESAKALGDALESALERRVISVNLVNADDVGASDTELSLRRSQIKEATRLLEEAEKLAVDKQRASSATPVPLEPGAKPWLWPVLTLAAVALCVLAGVLLALR